MPSSVLLALVVAAGVLILMPALAHRYDTALRGQAELRASSMRVLPRERRRRTVPSGGPVRPPTSLIVPAAVRTVQGISADGRDLTAVRASLVREVIRDGAAGPRARVRVRRPSVGDRPASAIPVSAAPVSSPVAARQAGGPGAARQVSGSAGVRQAGGSVADRSAADRAADRSAAARPVSVAPVPQSSPTVVPAAAVRRAAELQRARRRRLVLLLALLVAGQAIVGFFAGPAFWAGAAISGLAAVGLLARLRRIAAQRQRREAQERHAQVLVARARQHRAEAFVRRALRQAPAGVEREAWLGPEAVRQAAGWLALPRAERERPARDVIRVLAAAGREVYLAADGSWAVRPVARPGAGSSPAARRDAVRRDAVARRRTRTADTSLPRVVNG
ncbi:hypothetical protein [Cryptosporangium aurantiacum]|uniref:Uncharacterized protein n=1 Tax=Cryptosporangium aurantiacum TaxID=134849 RepID=A0A1M7RJR8_9ACTN|nr:hypothetical protein [Cryptosporangium aurantiacum]SHN46409.1 hypothetical protein SAMN05443668_11597 [Cryptosporangium aurantiacum]